MSPLQQLCERGQSLLIATDYFGAQEALVQAEAIALEIDDFDTLSRLYMPLQEARRQIRQRCSEGVVKLNLIARSPSENLDPEEIVKKHPQGQLLVAGWESPEPALRVRALAAERRLYLETFVASALPNGAIQIHPALQLREADLAEIRPLELCERLSAPLLAEADACGDLRRKIDLYRQTIEVDYACELAHQRLSATAHELARQAK